MIKKYRITILMILAVLITTYSYGQSGPIEAGENIAVVSTKYGKVRGYIDDGVFAFRGIPYAKAERFMPPQAPDKWDDVRQCTIYGPQTMQSKAQSWDGQSDENFGLQFNREPMDEKECFVVNVWSKGINDGKKRPVWVWIHGGGFTGGSGNQLAYFDGRAMAEKGDIVVVSLNHRLNVLGYVDLRGLGGKYSESVNLGMQDLVVALQWVKDNIANFGGDPNTVTINGQSGGGGKSCTLLAMPSAVGLFQRAIIQSGSLEFKMTGENSKAYGLELAAALGVNSENTEKLNDFTYEELIAAAGVAANNMTDGRSIMGWYCPTVDGKYVVQNPLANTIPEFSKNVSVLLGSNLNEFTYYNRAIITPKSMEEVKSRLAQSFGSENVEKFINLYNNVFPDDDQPQHMLTFDSNLRSGALKQATSRSEQGNAPVYNYLFTWQSPVNDGSLGAAHGMELPFMFNNIALARNQTGGGKDAYELADKISSAWINFVKTGDPNCKELPNWRAYTPENGATMIFDNKCKLVSNHDKELIKFMDTFSFPLMGSR
ncbi:MAG TPA: carboxylesterase family protein [Draconibacterium sp.]|nr:carboxylesterase family protein [Draconibacterium sp.]